jgi:hypothetical protein
MIRFKIKVRMTDNTTEITIEARQPMREARMLTPSVSSNGVAPRGTRHRRLVRATDHQACGPCSSRRSVEGRNSGVVAPTAAGLGQAAADHVADA